MEVVQAADNTWNFIGAVFVLTPFLAFRPEVLFLAVFGLGYNSVPRDLPD